MVAYAGGGDVLRGCRRFGRPRFLSVPVSAEPGFWL